MWDCIMVANLDVARFCEFIVFVTKWDVARDMGVLIRGWDGVGDGNGVGDGVWMGCGLGGGAKRCTRNVRKE